MNTINSKQLDQSFNKYWKQMDGHFLNIVQPDVKSVRTRCQTMYMDLLFSLQGNCDEEMWLDLKGEKKLVLSLINSGKKNWIKKEHESTMLLFISRLSFDQSDETLNKADHFYYSHLNYQRIINYLFEILYDL
jgi:hypothetical protein